MRSAASVVIERRDGSEDIGHIDAGHDPPALIDEHGNRASIPWRKSRMKWLFVEPRMRKPIQWVGSQGRRTG
jgi:hypothetical protein